MTGRGEEKGDGGGRHLLALNGAASQRDRVQQAPAPERVRVDGRGLPDLLRFGADYGRLIRFYDLSDVPDGDWYVFFAADPSVRLALETGADIAALETEIEDHLDTLRDASGFDARLLAARAVLLVIARLLRLLSGQEVEPQDGAAQDGAAIEDVLAKAIASRRHPALASPARRLLLHLRSSPLEQALRREVRELADAWFHQFVTFLEEFAAALLAAIREQQANADTALEPSLHRRGHPSQGALWDAFCILFGHARRTINLFPRRLISFYQQAILHQDSRPPAISDAGQNPSVPDLTSVGQTALPNPTAVPASGAGGSSGSAVQAPSTTAAPCTVTGLKTLQVVFGPLTPPNVDTGGQAGSDVAPVPQHVLSGVVTLQAKPPIIASPFPLFGSKEAGVAGSLTTQPASLGFAITSTTLMLAGGQRTIAMALAISPDSLALLAPLLTAIGKAAGGLDGNTVLSQVMQGGLALSYSASAGWVAVQGFTVTQPPPDSNIFTLSFTLDADAKPFEPFATPPPGVVPDAAQPTLLAALLQAPVPVGQQGTQVPVYPYTLLSLINLATLTINVTVTGLAALTVSNPTGPVDTSQPFAVFGTPPVQSATLQVSAPELWVKAISGLTLSIGWFGLPVTRSGFYGYYYTYVVNADGATVDPGSLFDNTTFQVTLDVADAGLWTIPPPQQDAQPLYLFRTGDGVSPPEPQAALVSDSSWAVSTQASVPAPYYQPANSALCLTLSEPAYAFGDVLYAPNVMAASLRLTAAASACAQQCARLPERQGLAQHLAPVQTVVTQAPDAGFADALRNAVRTTLSNLNGVALTLVKDAIAKSDAAEAAVSQWLSSLTAALSKPAPRSLFGDHTQSELHQHPSGTVLANLKDWIESFGAALGEAVQGLVNDARQILAAGESLAKAHAQAARQPASVARPTMTAATQEAQAKLPAAAATPPTAGDMQACIQNCLAKTSPLGLPNQPWVPMAASITLDYTAAATLPGADPATSGTFFHLLPFDAVAAAGWQSGSVVPLLAPVNPAAVLLVTLSKPTTDLSLLFDLKQPPNGWPAKTPDVSWAQQGMSGWQTLAPLLDTTGNLANPGVVALKLTLDAAAAEAQLRVGVDQGADLFPLLADLVSNPTAAAQTSQGDVADGGAAVPAQPITTGGSAQPPTGATGQTSASDSQSTAADPAFEMWLAERLRHKTFGVQGWDYARLLLDAFPLLWQIAVVPAAAQDGAPAPGHVWVVPVPGPQTPNIADPRQPVSDGATLAAIQALMSRRISPFVRLQVTNPPYLPIKVSANLVFTGSATAAAYQARLNSELIAFLSPWPPDDLGPRPADYYTERGVAQFIRRRPYVQAILSIRFDPDPPSDSRGWRYVTSAAEHAINGKLALPRVVV